MAQCKQGMISVIDALNMDCILAHALTLIPVGVPGSASHFARSTYTLIINKVRYVGFGMERPLMAGEVANDGSAFWPRQQTHNMQNIFCSFLLSQKNFLESPQKMWEKDEV